MKIILELTDGKLDTQSDTPVSFHELQDILMTAQLGAMQSLVKQAPQEDQQQLTEALYDEFNLVASALLATFAPELELRPGLTEEAIMQYENNILSDMLCDDGESTDN